MVIASHVLEHTKNTRETLREWFRVLKEGGKVAICVPHGEDVNWEILGTSDLTHEQLFTEKTLELYLRHAGFKNVKTEAYERPYAYKKTRGIFASCNK
jgi:predicted SAM-dependent methyltransferase